MMISQTLDYILFAGLILGSGLIGIYYGWCKKSRTVNEYILRDQTLVYPTIMSIIITYTSPKQLLADSTDVVMFGTQFGFTVILGYTMGCAIFVVFFLPVLVSLTGRSLLEYFELRYNKNVRMMAAVVSLLKEVLIIISTLTWLTRALHRTSGTNLFVLCAICTATIAIKERIFGCSLGLLFAVYAMLIINVAKYGSNVRKVLGVPVFYSSVALVLLCLFYTTLVGVSAVIWTGTLQHGYYFFTVVFCLVFGVYQVGGVSTVWQDGLDGGRIEFFNFGQRLLQDRTNFGGVVGTTLHALSVGLTNQSFYQRMVGIKEATKPIKVVFLSYCGTTLSRLGGIMTGLVVYSYFKDCHPLLTKVHVEKVMSMCFVPDAFSISYSDPLGEGCGVWTWGNNYGAGVVFLTDSKKEITNPDQIVAQFIKKIAEVIPGVLGLFCAGVVAASLSTMSSCLNTMACSVHDDLVLRLTSGPIPQKLSFLIMKGLIFLFGIGALAFTPLYSGVQSFLQVIISTNAVINSGFLGMFISSMVNPWVTSKGLITGAAAGTAVPMLLALNFMQLESQGKLVYYPKLVTTTGCNQPRFGGNFTRTLNYGFGGQGTTVFMDFTDFLSKLSAVSFQWYLPIGITVSFVVSAIVSFCAGGQDLSDVDPRLIIPHLRWILPKEVPPQRDQDDQESVPLKIIDDPKKDVAGISG